MANGESNHQRVPLDEKRREAAEMTAGTYAWEYFRYHAGQRLSVFRFYLTFIAAATVAYGYSQRLESQRPLAIYVQGAQIEEKSVSPASHDSRRQQSTDIGLLVGLVYLVTSFLFWRLDERNRILIGFSEQALKNAEERLASVIQDPSIRLMDLGDKRNSGFWFRYFERFKQIHRWIFLLVGGAGLVLILQHFGLF